MYAEIFLKRHNVEIYPYYLNEAVADIVKRCIIQELNSLKTFGGILRAVPSKVLDVNCKVNKGKETVVSRKRLQVF